MDRHLYLIASAIAVLLRTPCSASTRDEIVSGEPDTPFDLSCSVSSPIDKFPVVWTFNDTAVVNKDKVYHIFVENSTLRVWKVDRDHVGVYNCSQGNITETSFNILVKPYVTHFEKPRNVIQDDPMKIECKAWGIPNPTITWFFNGSQVVPEGSDGNIVLSNSTYLENATLVFKQMDENAGGNYTCYATSRILDRVYVSNATLLVTVKDKYAALWPFLGICAEVAVLCTIILIYEKRRAKRIEQEERAEEAAHLNANSDTKTPLNDDVRQRK